MVDNVAEIKPRSVEEIALESDNQSLREFSLRITAMREEAETRLIHGFYKVGLGGLPLSVMTIVAGGVFIQEGNYLGGLIFILGIFSVTFMLSGAASDFNASSIARGEVNSLTTVLASHLITESK